MILMLILKFILGLQSQSSDFSDYFDKADISKGEQVFIEIHSNFKSNVMLI